MLKFPIILLIVIYVWSILNKVTKYIKIDSCITVLLEFWHSASPSTHAPVLVGNNHRKYLSAVLAKYPNICEFTSPYSAALSYGASDYDNYIASGKLLDELLMQQNFIKKEISTCLNPINAVKILFFLPSSVLKLFGFKLNPFAATFLNFIGAVIMYFLDMYQEEIKFLISSLLKLH